MGLFDGSDMWARFNFSVLLLFSNTEVVEFFVVMEVEEMGAVTNNGRFTSVTTNDASPDHITDGVDFPHTIIESTSFRHEG